MYLIHWPVRLTEMISRTPVAAEIIRPLDVKGVWEGMEECKNLGLTKGIGLSNFSCKKIEEVLSIAKIPPALNQVSIYLKTNSVLCVLSTTQRPFLKL